MSKAPILLLLPLSMLAACSTGSSPSSSAPESVTPTASLASTPSATSSPTNSPTATPSDQCLTSNLSVKLGAGGGAAGSVYEPIIFTNKGTSECSLYGYPGVTFVAPGDGAQVGAAATRNPTQSPSAIHLAVGASGSALLQVAEYLNYPASDCKATAVGGLRVYPPGETHSWIIPLTGNQKACSSAVDQLTIQAVVAGSTGQ